MLCLFGMLICGIMWAISSPLELVSWVLLLAQITELLTALPCIPRNLGVLSAQTRVSLDNILRRSDIKKHQMNVYTFLLSSGLQNQTSCHLMTSGISPTSFSEKMPWSTTVGKPCSPELPGSVRTTSGGGSCWRTPGPRSWRLAWTAPGPARSPSTTMNCRVRSSCPSWIWSTASLPPTCK